MDTHALANQLAALNATLNALSAVLIFCAFFAIKRRNIRAHSALMLSAFSVSALFLVSYLTRVYLSGTHNYPGHGAWKVIYFSILFSHMALAVITPVLVIRAIYLARRERFAEHKRLVKYTFPIWAYVSVTGVMVYLLLYHPPG
jgi:uncharacterized membrane protein YozB (DUF420 family)